jgi:hypothetical protein
MGFMFRIEQITVREAHTFLTGHMISGALAWHQRIDVQSEDLKTVFTAPLCGLSSPEDTGLTMFDPALWQRVLAFPLSISRDQRVGLILDGAPTPADLSVPAIAVGIEAAPVSAEQLQTAFRSADVPAWCGADFGTPLCEYPYQMSKRGMLMFAPWGMFFVTIVLSLVFVAFAFNKLPLHGSSFGKIVACAMLGLFDVLFLYFYVKMMLAKPGLVVVTAKGIQFPIIQPRFASHQVFVSFDEMDDMMEYWHKDACKCSSSKPHVELFISTCS